MATRKTPTRKKTASPASNAPAAKKTAAKKVRKPPQAAQVINTLVVDAPAVAVPLTPAAVHADGSPHAWVTAVHAAESKKALNVKVLDLREVTSFCDFFIIASGTNPKQVQAIAEGIDRELRTVGERANAVEGFDNAEWILADYGDFIVHVFSEKAREFYDLERLWRAAHDVPLTPAP